MLNTNDSLFSCTTPVYCTASVKKTRYVSPSSPPGNEWERRTHLSLFQQRITNEDCFSSVKNGPHLICVLPRFKNYMIFSCNSSCGHKTEKFHATQCNPIKQSCNKPLQDYCVVPFLYLTKQKKSRGFPKNSPCCFKM